MAIKLLIGGSPCTHWSIAQRNRETKAEGLGWELFRNYLITKDKFNPDFFLYENNKSASKEIKEQIAKELGVGIDPSAKFTYINSALVSAQNRQRFYVTNFGEIEQPVDRAILLKDVLETNGENVSEKEKSYCLTATYNGATLSNTLDRKQRTMVAEPVIYQRPHGNNPGGIKTNKTPTMTANSFVDNNLLIEKVGIMWKMDGSPGADSQGNRIHSITGKSVTFTGNVGGGGAKTGFYAIPDNKSNKVIEVKNGQVVINGKFHKMKLDDGFYIFRKLTVTECERLQTLPDGYCRTVSKTQAYKALGNGWTAEVIIHLLNHALLDISRDEEIIVLSLYDGIATGRYCLDKMGFTNVTYYAYEIDKHAISVAMDNYPDIIQCGDAFAVREETWKPPQTRSEWLDGLLGGSV